MLLKLKKICAGGKVLRNQKLKNFNTIKIGGKAKYVVYPSSAEQIFDLVQFLKHKKVKYYVLGNGSNVLISDKGYNGVIICLKKLNEIRRYGNFLQVGAGTQLAKVVNFANAEGLGGMEDAMGIPGTIGGAVVMNASAYNYETKKVVAGVLVLRGDKFNYLSTDACDFSYRHSSITLNDIIVSVDIRLEESDVNKLKLRSYEIIKSRINLPKLPSLGSVFKRQDGIIVSKMLDEMGFKGARVGDAMVSYEHAGFIINMGNATEKDVKTLINLIKQRCRTEQQLDLMEEIRYL